MIELPDHTDSELRLKLLDLQTHLGTISKDKNNPFFKSKYFDINQLVEVLKPELSARGLLLTQPIHDNCVVSKITNVETGSFVLSSLALSKKDDPQRRGAEVTLFRRYTLGSLLAIQAEDDDGNKASSRSNFKTPKETKTKPNTKPENKSSSFFAHVRALKTDNNGTELTKLLTANGFLNPEGRPVTDLDADKYDAGYKLVYPYSKKK